MLLTDVLNSCLRSPTLHNQPDRDVAELLATPAIWVPGMTGDEWNAELDRSFDRALATRDFLDGQLTPDQFEDALYHFGIPDPFQLAEVWEEGKTFL